jgi:hypothetical protein
MPLPSAPTSEWVTRNGARYAATPEEATRAFGATPLEPHSADPAQQVASGACTQVLLRKALDGTYALLLNGRESTANPTTGLHTLPPFRVQTLLREEATGRRVPAPVAVSLLLEQGACPPDEVRLSVLQRTFVSGTQIDEGRETIAMEVRLTPTTPSDVQSAAVVVAYPMRIGPSAKIVLKDRSDERSGLTTGLANTYMSAFSAANNAVRGRGASMQDVTAILSNAGRGA